MSLVAPFKLSDLNAFDKNVVSSKIENLFGKVLLVNDFISKKEVEFLVSETTFKKQIPVGITGKVNETKEDELIRSYRLTTLDESLASILWNRIHHIFSDMENPYKNNEIWKPIGINPSFRYIKYTDNGLLVPHYDFPYEESDSKMTLMSLVMYLTDNEDGTTDFVNEYRKDDDSDWDRMAEDKDIYFSNKPKLGSALIFPHNILHQGGLLNSPKTIIRTDIMYEKA